MLRVALLVSMCGAIAGASGVPGQSEIRTRSIYLSAVDDKGRAVVDLSPQEFVVKEDGKTRLIVSIGEATGKLSVAMLVDDSGVGMNDFRIGVATFMNRLIEQAEFSLTGIAEQNRLLVDFTNDSVALANGIRNLIAHNVNGGGHLVEAVIDAATIMARREVRRPVIVILTNQANEYGDIPAARAMSDVARAGASLYVVEVLRPSGRTRAQTESYDAMAAVASGHEQDSANRARNSILGDGPRQTGGRRDEAIATADVPKALAAIAEELAAQVVLTYQTDARSGGSSKIEASTTRRDVTIRGPSRASDRSIR